jgi:predicted Zn-dependent peptidase
MKPTLRKLRNLDRQLLAMLTCILLLATTARAQVDRSQRPAPGPLPSAAFPPYSEIKLSNGLRIVVVEDHRQPIVYFRTMILTGGATDGAHIGTTGAVTYLLEKGTTTRSADDIAKKLDFYGSQIGIGANSDQVSVYTSILKKDLKEVLPVYADVMLHPTFPQSELHKYISQRVAAIKQDQQDPSYPGRMLGRKLIFGDHPYGAVETEATTKALTRDVIAAWHAQNFVANNAVIAVVGDVSKDEIVPMLEKQFGTWQQGNPPKPQYTELHDVSGTQIYLIDRPGSVQSDIRLERLGLRRAEPDFDKASFLAAIFAGNGSIGFQNRLTQNIREKHGYTYSPGGSLTSSIDRGVLVAVAEVRNAVTDSALDQMLIEYKRLANEEIPADELTLSKSIVTGSYLMSLADPATTSSNLMELMEYELPSDYFQTYANRINAITSADLKAVAQKVYPSDNLIAIVTGDAKEIKPKLDRFGAVRVYNTDLEPEGTLHMTTADLPLDEVLDKYYAALSKSALEKIHDRTTVADVTITMTGNEMPGTLLTVEAAPNKKYERLTLTYGVMENWVDGKHVWMQQGPQSKELRGPALQEQLAEAEWAPELHLKDKSKKVMLVGMQKLKSGEETYVIQVEKPVGGIEKWYISKNTWLLVRKDQAVEGGTVVSEYSDFRKVNGVMIPYKTVQSGAQDITISLTDVQDNTHPDPKNFVKPSADQKAK